ncbi:hypothetical protein GMOD_00008749 [Pyrenophora seminiperda CCB06]|uniref:Uncharacterized protein n=1 Tax=Pyrenophora seminiperda CCB06 TaxID=1302712 RepID=A0A3M7M5Z4_9PLEO|nr:hypothetical protein GMOD_00008749 [Pyrenophora seminiperda CCB06]
MLTVLLGTVSIANTSYSLSHIKRCKSGHKTRLLLPSLTISFSSCWRFQIPYSLPFACLLP